MNGIPTPITGFKVVDMSDGAVIQKDDMLHTLNTTAYEIFTLVDGTASVEDIINKMQENYPDDDIKTVVNEFIDQLKSSGLIEFES